MTRFKNRLITWKDLEPRKPWEKIAETLSAMFIVLGTPAGIWAYYLITGEIVR